MWQDPIVKETRELRKKYADQFNNDPNAIYKDICNRQDQTKRKRVSFPSRRPNKAFAHGSK